MAFGRHKANALAAKAIKDQAAQAAAARAQAQQFAEAEAKRLAASDAARLEASNRNNELLAQLAAGSPETQMFDDRSKSLLSRRKRGAFGLSATRAVFGMAGKMFGLGGGKNTLGGGGGQA